MIVIFWKYVVGRIQEEPTSWYIELLIVLMLGTVLFVTLMGVKRGLMWSARLLFLEYLFWILSLTLFCRVIQVERMYTLPSFRIFHALRLGEYHSLTECISNVVAFIPIGFLLGLSFPNIKWWKVFLIGGAISLFIEVFQFFFRRGFAEFDDVFNNVAGCIIGYGVYYGFSCLVKRRFKKRQFTAA